MASNRFFGWLGILALVCGTVSAEATPSFSMTCTCQPSATHNWRVIFSVNSDMSGAFTANVQGSFPPSGSYPQTQGPSSGNLSGYGSTQLYGKYQVQFPDLSWVDMGIALGPFAADSSYTSSFDFTPLNCIPEGTTNPDTPVTLGNNNPYGGTFTPVDPSNNPLSPPSGWPTNQPWPPYVPPGGSTNITITTNILAGWGLSNVNQITWVYNAAPPPVVTNTVALTNLTTTITNINGTNTTITVTNVSYITSTTGGLPSGGSGTGSATDGIELLSGAQLENLEAIADNTASTTNLLGQIRDNQTNSVPESQWADLFAEQRAQGEAAASSITNMIQIPVFDGNTGMGQGGAPTFSYTFAGRTYAITPANINVNGMISAFRSFLVYLIWAVTAWACWSSIESNIRMIINAQQFGTASKGGGVGSFIVSIIKKALAVAAVIVTVWVGAVGAIMFQYGPLASYLVINPMTHLSSFPYIIWLNSIVPISEIIIAVFAYIAFRIVSYAAAVFATVVSRFMVGV